MYYIYGISGSSLLIESTDSMIHRCEGYKGGVRGRTDSYACPSVLYRMLLSWFVQQSVCHYRARNFQRPFWQRRVRVYSKIKSCFQSNCVQSVHSNYHCVPLFNNDVVNIIQSSLQLPAWYIITINLTVSRVWQQWCSFVQQLWTTTKEFKIMYGVSVLVQCTLQNVVFSHSGSFPTDYKMIICSRLPRASHL